MSARHIVIPLLCALSLSLLAACASGRGGGGGAVSAARGEKYFKMKCNSCHPGDGQGAGPALLGKALPGPLKQSSSGGRHNVPAAEWGSLLAFLTPIMHPPTAVPSGVAPAIPATAPPGMMSCNCTCQCPAGAPRGQQQNCACACACPPA